ncbi:MAG: F0F1 ATP synthase subunit A [Neisseriaceae bacterium]|nr:F0F1 ATP synthase subunit A [Neisseriaceae bacterium]
MATEHEAMSGAEYIKHHLVHLSNQSTPQSNIIDFNYLNLDSIILSVVLGGLGCFFLWRAAQKASAGVPSRFLAAVEILIEWVDKSSKDIIHNEQTRKLVSPLALTVFVWIFLMNAMDLLPVDLLPWAWQHITGDHHAYLRVVPTADINTPLAMAIGVLALCLFYNVKIKGLGGWMHEMLTAPFGKSPFLWVFNFVLNIIEFVAKTVSHGLRLFGNMYAGELVFLLIAMLGGAWASGGSVGFLDPILYIGHILAGAVWAIFHILIILLQAFIFMTLALVYIGQAHDSH